MHTSHASGAAVSAVHSQTPVGTVSRVVAWRWTGVVFNGLSLAIRQKGNLQAPVHAESAHVRRRCASVVCSFEYLPHSQRGPCAGCRTPFMTGQQVVIRQKGCRPIWREVVL